MNHSEAEPERKVYVKPGFVLETELDINASSGIVPQPRPDGFPVDPGKLLYP